MLIDFILAENIKNYRKASGLTQTQLAEKIGVSCQAISKWERCEAMPELDKLCLLSDELSVSVDDIIGNAKNLKKVMIAVDGGGSKTEFLLFDEDGNILKELRLGACNPISIGIDKSAQLLIDGIEQLREICANISGIYIGSAGFKTSENGKKINAILSKRYPHIRIWCETDVKNVFASVEGEEDCIAGICGTGTVVLLKQGEKYTQFTGWGYLLDSAGSGFHIGRDGIVAALEQLEGLGEQTVLTELIEKQLGASIKEKLREFYTKDSSYIASFAGCVFEAFEKGDKEAKRILEINAKRFAFVINNVAKNYKEIKKVVLAGGIITQNLVFLDMVKKYLDSKLAVMLPEISQVQGAAVLCAEKCNMDTTKIYKVFKGEI